MLDITFYDMGEVDDSLFRFAVIVCRYNGKWIYCKHEKRETWEIPGGRREAGENILETAKRELFEETGALEYALEPICAYSVMREEESFGMLFLAEIHELGRLPDSEIERIEFFCYEPDNLTYPEIQPKLLKKVREVKGE